MTATRRPRYAPSRPGWSEKDAPQRERKRAIRTKVVRELQEAAKQRFYKSKRAESPVMPAKGTVAFTKRQAIALGQNLANLGVSPVARSVAMQLWACANELGETYVSQARLVELTGWSERAVRNAIRELERAEKAVCIGIPNHYRPVERAGTVTQLALPLDTELTTEACFPRMPESRRSTPPQPLPPSTAEVVAKITAKIAGERPQVSPAQSAEEASQIGNSSLPCERARDEEVTSGEADAPAGAPIGAIDATPEPVDQAPTRGANASAEPTRTELAVERELNRRLEAQRRKMLPTRKRPDTAAAIAKREQQPWLKGPLSQLLAWGVVTTADTLAGTPRTIRTKGRRAEIEPEEPEKPEKPEAADDGDPTCAVTQTLREPNS